MSNSYKLVWTPLALNRLEEIVDMISKDKPMAAKKWVDTLFTKIEQIKPLPNSGRKLPEFNRKMLREIAYGRYRIIYRVEKSQVSILTIRNVRQQLSSDDLA